jgi:hypothetical protein
MNCDCGKRMKCFDTREAGNDRYRRYKCECGNRITTIEARVDCSGKVKMRDALKKQLLDGVGARELNVMVFNDSDRGVLLSLLGMQDES